MKDQVFVMVLLICSVALSPFVAAQPATGGVPVNILVTAESRHGEHPGPITREDVMVFEGKTRDQVTSWVPAQGDHAQLDLFILLDDSSGLSLGTQLGDISSFINAQPATTRVGVAGVNASPYFALSDLAKRWPSGGSPRREVVLVSDGIDRYYGEPGYQDPYVDAAIEDAQRAGIIVYAIYNPGAGHAGHSYWQNYWGQLYLAEAADATGGESYYIGFTGPAVAFAPFLDDVEHRLNNQYLLTFLAKPESKSGLRPVKVRTELPDTELVTAKKVFVPAATQ